MKLKMLLAIGSFVVIGAFFAGLIRLYQWQDRVNKEHINPALLRRPAVRAESGLSIVSPEVMALREKEETEKAAGLKTVSIAKEDIKFGDLIAENNVSERTMAAKDVPATAVGPSFRILGTYCATQVKKGEMIMNRDISYGWPPRSEAPPRAVAPVREATPE